MSALLFKIHVPHHWCSSVSSACTYLRASQCQITSLHLSSLSSLQALTLKSYHTLNKTATPLHPTLSSRALHTARGGNPRREERLRQRDGVPDEFRLVYAAPNEWYLRCAAGAVVAPLLVAAPAVALRPAATLLAVDSQVMTGACLYALLAVTVLLLVRRYPFRMYHSAARRQFLAVLTGPLLLNSRHVSLAEGEVSKVEDVSNILPWKKVLYTSKQGKLVLVDSAFRSAEMYNRLLGYHHDEGLGGEKDSGGDES